MIHFPNTERLTSLYFDLDEWLTGLQALPFEQLMRTVDEKLNTEANLGNRPSPEMPEVVVRSSLSRVWRAINLETGDLLAPYTRISLF